VLLLLLLLLLSLFSPAPSLSKTCSATANHVRGARGKGLSKSTIGLIIATGTGATSLTGKFDRVEVPSAAAALVAV
jgi:hypothetical protein